VPAPAAASAQAGRPAGEARRDAFRYRAEVRAPTGFLAALTEHVDLLRWQDFADMSLPLFERIVREAPAQARAVADVLGYFSAEARVTVDRSTDPALVTLLLEPGAPVRVSSVRIDFDGSISSDSPAGPAAIARARAGWRLERGEVFRQDDWEAEKRRVLETVRASRYASATISRSEAFVDPDAGSAALSVDIASGPPFRFGEIRVRGLTRYPESLVRNFSTFEPGQPFSQETLDTYLRRLNATAYFASVQGAIDADPANADAAPVDVSVIEAPTRRLEFGIGYSTDTEFRGNLSWRDVNLDNRGLQFSLDGRLETRIRTLAARFVRPPTESGWRDSFGAEAERTDIENLVTRTAIVAARRQSIDERRQWAFGVAYYDDEQRPVGAENTNAHALFIDGSWTRRDVDDLISPTRGTTFMVQAGVGPPGVSSREFTRAIVRFQAWRPVGRANDLSLRAEAGAVFAKSREGVPSALLFRTGGDNTVRGYAFQSLGVEDGSAIVPGRYYALASAEATRWFGENWGAALFVDAGNAADEPSDLAKLKVGFGVGGRFRTPIGPFRLDLAYGEDTRKLRIHFSVGVAF
jgi:translocation and assembly module TamA